MDHPAAALTAAEVSARIRAEAAAQVIHLIQAIIRVQDRTTAITDLVTTAATTEDIIVGTVTIERHLSSEKIL